MADAIAVVNAGSSSIKFSLFAEADGGLGLGLRELALVLQEFGKGLMPEPVLSTVLLGGGATAPLSPCSRAPRLRHEPLERESSGDGVVVDGSDGAIVAGRSFVAGVSPPLRMRSRQDGVRASALYCRRRHRGACQYRGH